MKTIAQFLNPEEARVAKSYLAANGVDAIISGEESLSVMPHIAMGTKNYQLMVLEEDEVSALHLLSMVGQDETNEDEGSDTVATRRQNKRQLFFTAALIASAIAILFGHGMAATVWIDDPNLNVRGLVDLTSCGCFCCWFGNY